MGRAPFLALLLACGCNARLGGDTLDAHGSPDSSHRDGHVIDSPPDSSLGPWGAPQLVPGASDPAVAEDDVTLSSTLTELYFRKPVAGQSSDLFWMTRATPQSPWGAPQPLTQLNTIAAEESPRLSPDDLT